MSPRKEIGIVLALGVLLLAGIWIVPMLVKAERAVKFQAAFDKLQKRPSLSVDQVAQLMGQPLRIEHAETTGVTGDVYHYASYPPGGDFQVIFVNGVVLHTALPVYTPKT